MSLIRIIQYFWYKIFPKDRDDFEPGKEPSFFALYSGRIAGVFYHSYQNLKERARVWKAQEDRERTEYTIDLQILKHSKKLLWELFALAVFSLFFDSALQHYYIQIKELNLFHLRSIGQFTDIPRFTFPDSNFFQLALEIIIGAISAILGLIFALYAVGLQLTTEKYSAEVSNFINQDTVTNFFFKLLVFTDLYALFVLIKIKFLNSQPFFSFPAVIILATVSILGILIFKDHYILSLKPKRLFEKLGSDIIDSISLATNRKKITFYSWSVIQNAQTKARNSLTLIEQLFEDLWKAGNYTNAQYALPVLAYVMNNYSAKKRYIDKDTGWWAATKYKQVKSDNMVAINLKLNYEMRGQGPLYLTESDFAWFENKVEKIINGIEQKVEKTLEGSALLLSIIEAYKTILVGNYSRDNFNRYQKILPGLFEAQEMELAEKFFNNFIYLYPKIDSNKEIESDEYVNDYFAISLSILDGFGDYSKVESWVGKLIATNSILGIKERQVLTANLPTIFYEKIKDYWYRLEAEQSFEGKIITPAPLLKKEIIDDLKQTEKTMTAKYFRMILENQDKIMLGLVNVGQGKQIVQWLKIRMEWLARLIFLEKYEIAEEESDKIFSKMTIGYLLSLSKKDLVDYEMLEQLEKIIFPAIIEKQKKLFAGSVRALSMMLTILNDKETDVEKLVTTNRIIVITGGVCYLTAEFEQDWSFVTKYIYEMERIYKPGFFAKAVETLSDPQSLGGLNLKLKLISREVSRYNHWFGQIMYKISLLPKTYDNVRFYSGLQEVAAHPSKLIRELSYGVSNYEEDSIEAFVEYVKERQDLLNKMVNILANYAYAKT
ncbi:MAG: DUF2254 family protein [Candidatus Doudnabacteria bacterium]|nr:DUF2254 family protein [Candidatus Doudnabacteria bacterium]